MKIPTHKVFFIFQQRRKMYSEEILTFTYSLTIPIDPLSTIIKLFDDFATYSRQKLSQFAKFPLSFSNSSAHNPLFFSWHFPSFVSYKPFSAFCFTSSPIFLSHLITKAFTPLLFTFVLHMRSYFPSSTFFSFASFPLFISQRKTMPVARRIFQLSCS